MASSINQGRIDMHDSRWVRLSAVAGMVFAALAIVASRAQGSRPGLSEPADEVFTYLRDHQKGLQLSAALFAAAMVAALLWVGGLYAALRRAANGDASLAVVVVAGGVVAASMTMVSSALLAATTLRVEELGPATAHALFTLYQFLQVGTDFGLAVLIGAAAMVSKRTTLFGNRFTVASFAVAGLSFAGGFGIAYDADALQIISGAALILDSVWILLVSIRLWRTPEIALASDSVGLQRGTTPSITNTTI
jgi:hypothetical protein